MIDKIDLIVKEYENRRRYLSHNAELFEIYEGDLLPKVDKIMRSTLSESYYSAIRHRIFPINILKRIIDKLAQAYRHKPMRFTDKNMELLSFYEERFFMNKNMNICDEFSHLFKGFALEPFIDMGVPMLRVIPYDRFFVISESLVNPLRETIFVKVMGKKTLITSKGKKEVTVLFAWSDEEFIAITHEGEILTQFMSENEGINPVGKIPFYYGNRSCYEIMPVQDTDILQLSKLFPVLFSDTAGTAMFQAFSIIYGLDIDAENMRYSPNAIWSIKSDPKSDKEPKLGTLTPSANLSELIQMIQHFFGAWLESRGIKVGSIGNLDGGNVASGISKIIDEMDTFEQVKKSMEFFKVDENNFWKIQASIHNHWVTSGQLKGWPVIDDDWNVFVEFDEPRPMIDREREVNIVNLERSSGYISKKTAIKKLYPDWSNNDIENEMKQIDLEDGIGGEQVDTI